MKKLISILLAMAVICGTSMALTVDIDLSKYSDSELKQIIYYETNPYAKDKKLLNGYTSPFPPCETPAGEILCYESGQGCNRGSWRFPA